MERQLIWEKNINKDGAFSKELTKIKPNPMILRAIAEHKIKDVSLISGYFRGNQIVFEKWLWFLIESRTTINFWGVYTRAFESDEDQDQNLPWLCLRTSSWSKSSDIAFYKAQDSPPINYLLGDLQVQSLITFLSPNQSNEITFLAKELLDKVKQGIRVEQQLSEPNLDFIEFSISDDLNYDFSYTPFKFKCDEIESWGTKWREYFESLDYDTTLTPDGGLQISYRSSLWDRMRMFEFNPN